MSMVRGQSKGSLKHQSELSADQYELLDKIGEGYGLFFYCEQLYFVDYSTYFRKFPQNYLPLLLRAFSGQSPRLNSVSCSSYGSVWRAVHKQTKREVAIKQVKVENNLKDLLKETEHMLECKSKFVVSFDGSFLKDDTLWVRRIFFFHLVVSPWGVTYVCEPRLSWNMPLEAVFLT